MPDETQAESSTAIETPEPQAPEVPEESVAIFDEPEEAAQAESEEAEESAASEEETESEEDESVSASEAAKRSEEEKTPEKGETKAERRIKQLTAQLKAQEREIEALKQPKVERHQATKEPVRPNLETFEGTAEEYNRALEAYDREARKYAVEQDRLARQNEAQKAEFAKIEAEAKSAWDKRVERIAKSNAEFNAVKYLNTVQPNATTDGFLVDSEAGPEILNHLFENPELADKIRALPPYKAIRELVRLETKFSDQIKGIKPKAAPKPPKTVEGRQSAPAAPRTAADVLYG